MPIIVAILVNDGSIAVRAILDGLAQQNVPVHAVAIVNKGGPAIQARQFQGMPLDVYDASAEAGYAACVNPVLRHWMSQADAVWLLDGRPDPYALQQLWQASQSAVSHPSTSPHASDGQTTGQAIVSCGVSLSAALMTRAYRIDRLAGRLVPIGFTSEQAVMDNPRVEVLSRHGALIPTAVFRQIGVLDERLHKYWEMADFCVRAKQAGYGLKVHARAKVTVQQTAVVQTASDLFYLVRNRWWVVMPLQPWWQRATMMVSDGVIWFKLLLEWAGSAITGRGGSANAYEKVRLYWWGVYQGVHPFPPKID